MLEEVPSEGHLDVVSHPVELSLSVMGMSDIIIRVNGDLLVGSCNLPFAPKSLQSWR
jgi:hypothetical protein